MSFDYFDKIYCINLESRADRWEASCEEFEKVGLLDRVERFEGIPRREGIIGCTLSHVRLIERAKNKGFKNIFIFEDDIQFINYDDSIIKDAIKDLRQRKWGLFYLGSSANCKFHYTTPHLVRPVNSDGLKAAHAYAINSSAYNKILSHNWIWKQCEKEISFLSDESLRLYKHIDKFYRDILIPNYHCYHINPIMAVQRSSYSDVQNRDVDYSEWQVGRFEEKIKQMKEV